MSLSITAKALDAEYRATLDDFCGAIDHPAKQQASLAIYSNNLLAVHQRALENNFLTTRSQMGQSLFGALTQVYVQHYPAIRWDINLYGEQLPELIAQQTKGAKAQACDWKWLASIASIEYAICEIYYADNGKFQRDNAYFIEPICQQNTTDIASLLRQQHPYADIAKTLEINKTIILWRDAYRIRIENP